MAAWKANAASLLECVEMIACYSGRRPVLTYSESNRKGDHICYYTDLSKFRAHYPHWKLTYSLEQIVEEIVKTISDHGLV